MGEAWGFTLACFLLAWALAWLAAPSGLEARRECFWIVLFTSVLVLGLLGAAAPHQAPRHLGQHHDRDPARGAAEGGRLVHGEDDLGLEPWFIGTIFGLFLLGASTTKDFADIEGDRAGGCQTLPILYGVKKAAWMIAPFFVLPFLLIPIGVRTGHPDRQPAAARPARAAARRLRHLHRLPAGAEAGGAGVHREPPLVDAHVPDDDGGPGRLRAGLRALALLRDGAAAWHSVTSREI